MSTHTMELDNGHIILEEAGKRFVLDTGSPISFSDKPQTLTIAGNSHALQPSSLFNVESLNVLMTKPVNGLLGMDIFKGKSWELDFKNHTIRINEPASHSYADSIPLTVSEGYGVFFNTKVNGNDCCCILDTGAFVCYIDPQLLGNTPSCGNIDDYNPIIGEIHTTLHEVKIAMDKRTLKLKAGKMNGMMAQMHLLTSMLGLPDIRFFLGITPLGLDAVCIDFRQNLLRL